jgi:hypothetical protein
MTANEVIQRANEGDTLAAEMIVRAVATSPAKRTELEKAIVKALVKGAVQ